MIVCYKFRVKKLTGIVRILIKLWKEYMEYSKLLFFLELIYQHPTNVFVHENQMQGTTALHSSAEYCPTPRNLWSEESKPKNLVTWCYSLNDVHYSSSFQTPFVVLVCCWTSASYDGTRLVVLWFVVACLFVLNLKLECCVCQVRREVLARVPWSLEVVMWFWDIMNATRQSLFDSFPIADSTVIFLQKANVCSSSVLVPVLIYGFLLVCLLCLVWHLCNCLLVRLLEIT